MTKSFGVKARGRKRVTFKIRSIDNKYFKPQGFKFHKFNKKKGVVIFKKE